MGEVRPEIAKVCPAVLLLLGLLVIGPPVPAVAESASSCSDQRPIGLNQRLERWGGEVGESDCYRIDVPSPGILILDAATRGPALAEPKIGFPDRLGAKANAERPEYALGERTPSRMVLRISSPGTIAFRVAAQDPGAALEEYRLTSRFVESFLKDEDVGEIDPILGCHPEEGDDYGDLATCASALNAGESVGGELINAGSADDDYFTFVLTAHETVVIATGGETDTFGGLYDRRGYRLAADDDGGSGQNFRIVKTLVPGRYFVRVEGRGAAEGSYSLRLETVTW